MTLPRPFDDTTARHSVSPLGLLAPVGVLCCILPLLSSCDNGCEQLREAYMLSTFTSTSGRTLRSLSLTCLSEGKGYTATYSSFTDMELDLNPEATQSTLILDLGYSDYGDYYTASDTVTIDYTVQTRFLDMECGCTVVYHIDRVTATHNLLNNYILSNDRIMAEGNTTNIIFEY